MSQKVFDYLLQQSRSEHPELSQAIQKIGPLDLAPNQEHPFAVRLCRSIAGQQLSIKAAHSIWSRVEADAAEQDLLVHLHSTETEQLRACGLSAAKCKAIKGVASQAMEKKLECHVLAQLSVEEREQHLIALWGVGRWTIDMMNIFYFAEPDIWPDNDVTARKTLLRMAQSEEGSMELASRYAPYRSYLALYMYEIADALPD